MQTGTTNWVVSKIVTTPKNGERVLPEREIMGSKMPTATTPVCVKGN